MAFFLENKIYVFERWSYRNRDRKRDLPPAGLHSNGHRKEAQTRILKLHEFLTHGLQGLSAWAIFSYFLKCVSKELVGERSSWNSEWMLEWGAGIAGSVLTHCTQRLSRAPTKTSMCIFASLQKDIKLHLPESV